MPCSNCDPELRKPGRVVLLEEDCRTCIKCGEKAVSDEAMLLTAITCPYCQRTIVTWAKDMVELNGRKK